MVMKDVQQAIATMHAFSALGIQLAMDDFGTGYSSLSYLKRFPIHMLKIDKSFIRDIPDNPDDVAIAEAILCLAKGLGLKVWWPRGGESEAQLAFLREQGCGEVQGYLFSKPLPAGELENLLKRAT